MKKGLIKLKRASAEFTAAYCFLAESSPKLPGYLYSLHPREKDYYDRLRFARRKNSFLLGRAAAKLAVAELINVFDLKSILIDAGVFQFPVVRHVGTNNIQVSISHCDGWAVAVAFPEEHPLGVDLETVQRKNLEALAGHMTERERELLRPLALSAATGLTMLWTMKEGLSKVLRTGLTMDFKILELHALEAGESVIEGTYRNSIQYKALSFPSCEYVISLVLPKKTTPIMEDFWNSCNAFHTIPEIHNSQ